MAAWYSRFYLFLGYQPAFTEVSIKNPFGYPSWKWGSPMAGHIRVFTYRALKEFLEYYKFKNLKICGVKTVEYPLIGLCDSVLSKLFPSMAAQIVVIAKK
jgi:hypothetical protein